MSENQKICIKCHKPVTENIEHYEAHEKMHWICFHLEYEHQADPDSPCDDPSCPWWHIEVYKNKLISMGLEPKDILEKAIKDRWK